MQFMIPKALRRWTELESDPIWVLSTKILHDTYNVLTHRAVYWPATRK